MKRFGYSVLQAALMSLLCIAIVWGDFGCAGQTEPPSAIGKASALVIPSVDQQPGENLKQYFYSDGSVMAEESLTQTGRISTTEWFLPDGVPLARTEWDKCTACGRHGLAFALDDDGRIRSIFQTSGEYAEGFYLRFEPPVFPKRIRWMDDGNVVEEFDTP